MKITSPQKHKSQKELKTLLNQAEKEVKDKEDKGDKVKIIFSERMKKIAKETNSPLLAKLKD